MTPDTHRVYKITAADRRRFVDKRMEQDTTNETLLRTAVETKLDSLVESLNALGLNADTEDKRPIRLPMSDETLTALKVASENTGLPQAVLMTLVLRSYCVLGTAPKPAPKAAPKAKRKAASRNTAPKATGGTKTAPKAGKASGTARKTRASKTAPKTAPKRTNKKGAK